MNNYVCPVCEGSLERIDVPRHRLYRCINKNCEEIVQINGDETLSPMGSFLSRNALGDDRVRGVISSPRVSTVSSLIDVFENTTRFLQMDLAGAGGALRTLLTQIENRIDYGISKFAGLDMASDDAAEGLRALREAREMVSTLPKSHRGVTDADEQGLSSE